GGGSDHHFEKVVRYGLFIGQGVFQHKVVIRSGPLGDTGLSPIVAGADEIFGDEFAAVDHSQVDAQNRPELDGAGQVDVGVDGTGQGSGIDFIVSVFDNARGIENIVE